VVLLCCLLLRLRLRVPAPYEVNVWEQTAQSDAGNPPAGDIHPALAPDARDMHCRKLSRVVQVRDNEAVDNAEEEQRC
jgi:hypothetical protein